MADGTSLFSTLALDEILLDVATIIELSPNDRRIAENRYRQLKIYLERESSPLALHLVDGQSHIYAQGSMATSTTIVSGTDDDRFDVDAIVELDVPPEWSHSAALDILEKSLQGFPGAIEIVRCTRCVQLRFPSMHMDVAILDRRARVPIDRAGDIFHSPDCEDAYRVPSNPWGFTGWFRTNVTPSSVTEFAKELNQRRATISRDRLAALKAEPLELLAKAEQHELPPAIPSRLDAEAPIALKLLKRYLNLKYEEAPCKRPPSIYLTKVSGDIGNLGRGVSVQLFHLANTLAQRMRSHLATNTRPQEINPMYRLDVINDRWPRFGVEASEDMRVFAEILEELTAKLERAARSELSEIAKVLDELFGERVGVREREVIRNRYERLQGKDNLLIRPRSGAIVSPALAISQTALAEIPGHHFHSMDLNEEE